MKREEFEVYRNGDQARPMSKSDLYSDLSQHFVIPNKEDRCVTKNWLRLHYLDPRLFTIPIETWEALKDADPVRYSTRRRLKYTVGLTIQRLAGRIGDNLVRNRFLFPEGRLP